MSIAPIHCRITVRGRVASHWIRCLGGLQHSYRASDEGEIVTDLLGKLSDQSALQGVLKRIWDLNLRVVSFATSPGDALPAGPDD